MRRYEIMLAHLKALTTGKYPVSPLGHKLTCIYIPSSALAAVQKEALRRGIKVIIQAYSEHTNQFAMKIPSISKNRWRKFRRWLVKHDYVHGAGYD